MLVLLSTYFSVFLSSHVSQTNFPVFMITTFDFGIIYNLHYLLGIHWQMSAAAFAKGLLDLEGELTPILVCSLFLERV